jgi:hypothetical protein
MSKAQVLGFICMFTLASCVKKSTPAVNSTIGEFDFENYSEDLSIYRPNYKSIDTTIIETQKIEQAQSSVVELNAISQNTQIEAVLLKIATNNKNLNESRGYRLQVYVGNTKEGFQAAKLYLMNHYPELEIYESYSQPTYKIKIGDFIDRMDAEKYHASLKSRFTGSRIIADRINVKKGLKLN